MKPAPKPSKLDTLLTAVAEEAIYRATGGNTGLSRLSIPEAKSQILALIEEVGIKFLESCGEDDKIEAWKKYLKSGDQL